MNSELQESVAPHLAAFALRVKRERPEEEAALPHRHYTGDAGFDLSYAGAHVVTIPPGDCRDVPCGFSVQFPPHTWAMVVGRSSTFRTHGIMVNPAIIDAGFRGEIFAVCRNIGNREVKVTPGQRIAQIIPLPLLAETMPVIEVAQLDDSDRGTNGFGSTGS